MQRAASSIRSSIISVAKIMRRSTQTQSISHNTFLIRKDNSSSLTKRVVLSPCINQVTSRTIRKRASVFLLQGRSTHFSAKQRNGTQLQTRSTTATNLHRTEATKQIGTEKILLPLHQGMIQS